MITRAWRIGRWVLVAVVVLGVLAGVTISFALRGSLARETGTIEVAGVAGAVRVERDALGVPVIRGGSRADVAFATGFVHGQERFFQMDLMRRSAAGELAALLGPALVKADRAARVHPFRWVAHQSVALASPEQLRILKAYTAGVNAGLAALAVRPPEYLLLRQAPRPWRDDDTVLVLLAMFTLLQDGANREESARGVIHDLLPPPLAAFVDAAGTDLDAPIDGSALGLPPLPGAAVLDLRRRATKAATAPIAASGPADLLAVGSNNWALAGARTAHGGAMVANDMHLPLGLPATWYRAEVRWYDGGRERVVCGATLPGTPAVVVGSNRRVAWGFTNSYGDYADLVVIEETPGGYRTPAGDRGFGRRVEHIAVAGRLTGEELVVEETMWGPVVDRDHRGRRRALRWTAHDPEAVDLGLLALETADDVAAALAAGNRAGIPGQNLVVADAAGAIGWTIAGRLPRRVGCTGRTPASWADGGCRWDGLLPPAETPRVVDPAGGAIWTANARVVGGDALARVGDSGYALGARAGQIRDRLRALDRATERDLLAVQLDDRALFLERWQRLLARTLGDAGPGDARRRAVATLVGGWSGRAAVDSVAYRIVRAFRARAVELALAPLVQPCSAADERVSLRHLAQGEGAAWRLVTERPLHLLDPRFASWDALLLAAAADAAAQLEKEAGSLERATWGGRNTVRLRHPLAAAVPFLSRWLDAGPWELPGDSHVPRVQGPEFGSSQRMVVAPGREDDGIFELPGGQSGHPLSRHYADQAQAWAEGRATPFRPGPAVEVLTLHPALRP